MSKLQNFASKAAGIRLTPEEAEQASALPSSAPRTAPGQLMHLQARSEQQIKEIESLRTALAAAEHRETELALIDSVEGRKRKLTAEEYGELKANLRENPLLQPVVLRKKADGRFELVAGHNRVDVFRELGRERIASVIHDIADRDVNRFAFFSNLLAPALSDFEKYWNFQQLQIETQLSHTELAKAAGLARRHVSRIMRYDALPDEAKAALALKPERLGSAAAEALAQIAESGRGEEVTAAIKSLLADDSMTMEQAVALAKGPKPTQASRPEKMLVKVGKRHVCEIAVRSGSVGVTFKGDDAKQADAWAKKIRDFINEQAGK